MHPKSKTPPPPPPKATTPIVKAKPTKVAEKPGDGGQPRCPKCDKRMLIKKANHGGLFYGCSQWPACTGSRSWRDFGKVNSEPENT